MEKAKYLDLEDVVFLAAEKGKEWNKAKQISRRFDELKKCTLSKVMNYLEDHEYNGKKISEAKLKRLAEDSEEYRKHIDELLESERISSDLEIEYDSLINLFEAKRSNISLEKVKISAGI